MSLYFMSAAGLFYNLNVDENIPCMLYGDEIRIRQIILNITNNAIKYTKEGGITLNISFDKERSMLVCSVTDTGMGIKKEDMDNSLLLTEEEIALEEKLKAEKYMTKHDVAFVMRNHLKS